MRYLIAGAILAALGLFFIITGSAIQANADTVRGHGVVQQAGSAQAGDATGVAVGRTEQEFTGQSVSNLGILFGAAGVGLIFFGAFKTWESREDDRWEEWKEGAQDLSEDIEDLEASRGWRK